MKPYLRRAIIIALAVIFIGSASFIIYRVTQYRKGDKAYDEARELVELPDFSDPGSTATLDGTAGEDAGENGSPQTSDDNSDPYIGILESIDFSALREINEDVFGWIVIPDTVISYPLLDGDDNDYYLDHTWKNSRNSVGSIFLEQYNSSSLTDFNTIIYGHRMRNGSMFAALKNYSSMSYYEEHPVIYISTDSGTYRYEIFAAYEAKTSGSTYQIGFKDDESRQSFIDYCLEKSVIDTGIVPNAYDRVITLSTCTGNGYSSRWVVQGVLRRDPPAE